ncbi:glycoside hydrolase family protein [Leclercia adecarboxylata]|uniref:glycoside hydrolase family protein n=1 Tax=Leclercia adecarboxylata TaxID=83655 RepID=UPI00311C8FDE
MNEKQQRQDEILIMLKSLEGTKQYQEKLGCFRNRKFRIYKDSEGYETIGYDHLVLPVERQHFIDGITELQADQLLLLDYQKAVNGVQAINIKSCCIGYFWMLSYPASTRYHLNTL